MNKLYRSSDEGREQEPAVRQSVGIEKYRSAYRRDYARLIHSPAFRRLQGKTQVFPGDESDFFRNRLTHSLEVAQIAKGIAIRLNDTNDFFRQNPINEEIVEFAGLAHDLGHPPFGHNGERALDDCMKGFGGFEGNAQTLRILARSEKKEARSALPVGVDEQGGDYRLGLNLTYRSLAAVLKYDQSIPIVRESDDKVMKGYYASEQGLVERIKASVEPARAHSGKFKTIECSIMDVADDIAYSTYDLEDTFKAGFLAPLDIIATEDRALLDRVASKVAKATGRPFDAGNVLKVFVETFRDIFELGADDVNVSEGLTPEVISYVTAKASLASRQLAQNGYLRTDFTADLVSECIAGVQVAVDEETPAMSLAFLRPETLEKVEVLKHFTYEATIMSPRLRISEQRGYEVIKRMFEELSSKSGHLLLPADFRELYGRFKTAAEKKRVICDFLAGMTDRYAVEFYGRLVSEAPESIFKPF